MNLKSMRQKFFKRSAEKFVIRIDPESEAHRDLRVIFPGACPGKWVQGSALGYITIFFLGKNNFVNFTPVTIA